jgi:hypothetical protein
MDGDRAPDLLEERRSFVARRMVVKRYGWILLPLGTLIVVGVTGLRPGRHVEALPSVRPNEARVPIQFRQNQPRHWRYVVLSQGR